MKHVKAEEVVPMVVALLIAGVLLIAINGLVGGFIASHGAKLHGKTANGEDFEPGN